MSSNSISKFAGPIRVGSLSSDPASAENGMLYYNTATNKLRKYENGAWVDASSGTEFLTDTFRIEDASDATKKIAVDASAITTGTTRTITMPDSNVDLGLIATALQTSQLGAANGVASLDSGGLVPIGQIPPAALERLVVVADQTARFALTTSTVQNGDTVKQTDTGVMYFVVDQTNLGNSSGYSVYTAGTASAVAWSGVTGTPTTLSGYGITDAVPNTRTVNGHALSANVTVTSTDVGLGNVTNDAQLKASNLDTDGTLAANSDTKIPSQKAVKTYADTKLSSVQGDTAPTLGGDLTLNSKSLLGPMDRAAVGDASHFVQEEYKDAITLTASQSGTAASALSFAFATFAGCTIDYSIKEATTNRLRLGRLRVISDGTNLCLVDDFGETADVGVTWAAVVNGSNIDLQYTTTANNKTMRADIKRFRA